MRGMGNVKATGKKNLIWCRRLSGAGVVSRGLSVKVGRYQRGKAPTIPSRYFISIKQCICVCNQVWVRCLLFLQVTSNNDIVSVHHTNTMIPVLQCHNAGT